MKKLERTGVLNADRHKQFTIFNEVAKVITNCTSSFVNIIDQDTQQYKFWVGDRFFAATERINIRS